LAKRGEVEVSHHLRRNGPRILTILTLAVRGEAGEDGEEFRSVRLGPTTHTTAGDNKRPAGDAAAGGG